MSGEGTPQEQLDKFWAEFEPHKKEHGFTEEEMAWATHHTAFRYLYGYKFDV